MSAHLVRASGCACKHAQPTPNPTHVGAVTMPSPELMLERRWYPEPLTVASGADGGLRRVPCRIVWMQHGDHIHGYAKFRLPDGRVLMAHASTNLEEMEREISAEVRQALEQRVVAATAGGYAVSAGWLRKKFRKMKRKIKEVAKRTGITKVVKTVAKVAKKALDNPIVQAALATNPYGAAFLAARKGLQLAVSAAKGAKKAKNAISSLVQHAKKGNLKAKNMLKLVRNGVKQHAKLFKNVPALQRVASAGADDVSAFAALAAGAPVALHYFAGCGADVQSDMTDRDLDALEHFAESGAWEGVRWLADRLSLHSMDARPFEFSKRDALSLGRQSMGDRYAS